MPNMRPPHALSAGRLTALGAPRGFHHGLLSAVFSQDTLAVVAGYRIQPQDRRRGDEAEAHALLVDDEK